MAQSTIERPVGGPRPPQQRRRRQRVRSSVESMITLAKWQLGSTWKLLLLAEVGILAAVVLICLIPLYSSVALSAGLRDALTSDVQNAFITEHAQSMQYDSQQFAQFQQQVTRQIQKDMPGYVQLHPVFSMAMKPLPIAKGGFGVTNVDFTGFPEAQIPRHAKLIQGHLPKTDGNTVEFVTTSAGLATLQKTLPGYQLGHIFTYTFVLFQGYMNQPMTVTVSMQDVGVVTLDAQHDLFWDGQDFQTVVGPGVTSIPALIPNEALEHALTHIESTPQAQGYDLSPLLDDYWYYPLDLAHFDTEHLNDAVAGMNRLLQAGNMGGDTLSDPPYIGNTQMLGGLAVFSLYAQRITLMNVPIDTLILLIGGLILFFVSVIGSLLIEQQGEQIAFLRSRGATNTQLVGALSAQGGLLALPVLILGPILAYLLAIWYSNVALQGNDRISVNVLTSQPVASMLGVSWTALVVIVVALLVLAFALFQRVRSTVLTRRQEATRTGRRALWQRWRLDLVGAALAAVGAGFAIYLINSGILDARTRALILPVVLLGAFLGIVVAILLLLFRFFPGILGWGAKIAQRRRGVSAVLAIAQMARSPWQSARMTLLLAFTLAFAIFSLTFSNSQAQRIIAGTAFQIGSDFSGTLIGPGSMADWQVTEQGYAQIPGVISATIGHVGMMVNGNNVSVALAAVDAGTCAQTMDWSAPDSAQEVVPLLKQMVARRQTAEQANLVPAIIDASAAQSMGLSVGNKFGLRDGNGTVNFVVIGIVQHIPAIVDDQTSAGTSDVTITGGVLADYDTYANVQNNGSGLADAAETMWLKTSDNPRELAQMRHIFDVGPDILDDVSDRRAMIASLSYDPLEALVAGGLLAGAAVALVLGLIGSLLGSWTNARKRVVSFAMLRALGNTRGQLVAVILWEQAIIYTLALLMGIGGGLLFAKIVMPGLLYTPVLAVGATQALNTSSGLNMTGTGLIYLVQNVPTPQVIIPLVPILAVIALVALVTIISLAIIVRIVTRPALSEILRLNED